MQSEPFTFRDPEGIEIFVYKWLPGNMLKAKAVVQIAHGMAETGARYERFAKALTEAGYIVYANDHRGHGRTAKNLTIVGYMGKDGFNWAVKDLHQLTQLIKEENAGLPIFLLGHSMGSFLTQQYIYRYGSGLKGALLSGTSGNKGFILNIGIVLAKLTMIFKGAERASPLLNAMSFGSYNDQFKPNRTQFDWLSRDNAEVDKYVSDPFCGTLFSAGFFYDLFRGLKDIHRIQNQQKIPKNLPLYLFSGSMDPVGNYTKSVVQLIQTYQILKLSDVVYKFYSGGRHEMLNEINRDEVTQNIIGWLNVH